MTDSSQWETLTLEDLRQMSPQDRDQSRRTIAEDLELPIEDVHVCPVCGILIRGSFGEAHAIPGAWS